jgi:Arc/MetJ family transcription regulator
MTKRLVDIDDEILKRAQNALGTTTIEETVNASLTEVGRSVDRKALRMEDLQRVGELLTDLGDPKVMARAWE